MINYSDYIGLKYKCRGRGPKYYDCYGLCKKVYKKLLNIELLNHLEVPYNDKWYKQGKNYIIDNIDKNWVSVNKPYRKYDLIVLFNGKTTYPNHVALWIGNNKILHIYEGTTSRVDRYEGYWESKFHCALRWKNNG